MAQALILICADPIRNEIADSPARLLVWRRLWWPLFDWRDRDIALAVNYDGFYTRDPNILFAPHIVQIDTPKYSKKQLYFMDQGADFVPLKNVATGKFRSAARGHVPDDLIGKTSRDLWQKYGLAIAGAVAPDDAATAPLLCAGLIGWR